MTETDLPYDLLDGVDAFAAREPDHPDRAEAIRRILRDWLLHKGYIPHTDAGIRPQDLDATNDD